MALSWTRLAPSSRPSRRRAATWICPRRTSSARVTSSAWDWGDAVSYLFPQLPASGYEAVAARYRHHYFADDHAIPLFDGVSEMLQELAAAGLLLAVATGKGRCGLDRALASSGLALSFHATRCADETFSKPHPAMLLEIMDELGPAWRRWP